MMDAKARQDCIKEIDLLKVRLPLLMLYYYNSLDGTCWVCVRVGVNVCVGGWV